MKFIGENTKLMLKYTVVAFPPAWIVWSLLSFRLSRGPEYINHSVLTYGLPVWYRDSSGSYEWYLPTCCDAKVDYYLLLINILMVLVLTYIVVNLVTYRISLKK